MNLQLHTCHKQRQHLECDNVYLLLNHASFAVVQVDAVNSPPTTDNVRAGLLPSSAVVTAKGTFTAANRLTGSALVTGLASASNYTVSPLHLCCFCCISGQCQVCCNLLVLFDFCLPWLLSQSHCTKPNCLQSHHLLCICHKPPEKAMFGCVDHTGLLIYCASPQRSRNSLKLMYIGLITAVSVTVHT